MAEANVIDASRHPLVDGIAPDLASGWGEDDHGVVVEITVDEVTRGLLVPAGAVF